MLWIALFLPELPLQLAERACTEPLPRVVADGPATRPVVLCTSTPARELGVKIGMPIAAARALVTSNEVARLSTLLERGHRGD